MSRPPSDGGAPRGWLILTGLATTVLLALLVDRQTFDTNFYGLLEAPNLLAGDHPYRDFLEWGVPLQAAISALVQRLVGYRMAGEFVLVHWPFIVAGAVISFDLGYRLTRSIPATAFTTFLALEVLPDTPTFHYPKLFLYPAAVWLAWRYLERPGPGSAAALGLFTAAAFLFRHDHGIYIGVASVLACGLARWTAPDRPWRRSLADAGVYTAVAACVLLPWMLLVQSGEGLPLYVRTRSHLYDMWAGADSFAAILRRNPFALMHSWLPDTETAKLWRAQITIAVAFLLLASAGIALVRNRRTGTRPSLDTCRLLVAGGLLVVVDAKLFRELSYAHLVAPLTAAMGARFLTLPRQPGTWSRVRLAVAIGVAGVAALAGFAWMQPQALIGRDNRERAEEIFRRLWHSPPIDVAVAREEVDRWTEGHDAAAWEKGEVSSWWPILLRYVHDCTRDGDRVLVSGDTPFQVAYLVERPIAGGHVFWHHRWRSGAEFEPQLFSLVERQSIPFAISTHDPVLVDLAAYPHISRYFTANYTVLPGSHGQLLYDARRAPTGTFGPYGFPCFK